MKSSLKYYSYFFFFSRLRLIYDFSAKNNYVFQFTKNLKFFRKKYFEKGKKTVKNNKKKIVNASVLKTYAPLYSKY